MGGAMRQAGVVAAGALFGLDHHRARLVEDHQQARRLAEGLADAGVGCDPSRVVTNMVRFSVEGDAASFAEALAGVGVLVHPIGPRELRAVTHLGVGRDAIGDALTRIRRCLNP